MPIADNDSVVLIALCDNAPLDMDIGQPPVDSSEDEEKDDLTDAPRCCLAFAERTRTSRSLCNCIWLSNGFVPIGDPH